MDNILRQVEELNRSVNAADSITEEDVFNIINISRKGLYDALTGLPTRNLFRPAGQRHHRKDAGQAIRGLHPRHGQP